MNLPELLQALEANCEGKSQSDRVEVDVQLLLSAKDELNQQAQLREDLQQARDEASLRPSVARKLNECIRSLEGELERLRTNKKVQELEKKVQFLSEELKQSYTTKNFTLKTGLLDLEKQYRAAMNVDPAMAAFWADVTVLLDENRGKDAPLQFRGPPAPADLDSTTHPTPRQSTGSQLDAAAAAVAAAAGQGNSSMPGDAAAQQHGSGTSSSTSSNGGRLSPNGSTLQQQQQQQQGVQVQVKSFNTIISDEEASAASILQDRDKAPGQGPAGGGSGEVVVRQGAGFRVIRAVPPAESAGGPGESAGGAVSEEALQPVALLRGSYAGRLRDVTFTALPTDLQHKAAAAAAAAAAGDQSQQQQQQQQPPVDARAIDQQADTVSSSITTLQQLFEQLAAGNPDSSSAWQQQVQQLAAAVLHVKDSAAAAAAAAAAGSQRKSAASAAVLEQQQAEAELLLASVQQLQESFAAAGDSSSSSSSATSDAITAAAVAKQLAAVQQEVARLQQLQQQASRDAGSQELLVQVFGEFLQQLVQQGVIAPTSMAAAPAYGDSADGQQQQQQHEEQHVLLGLLKEFLAANPHLPQLLASQLTPPLPVAAEQPTVAERSAVAEPSDASNRTPRALSVDVSTQADAMELLAAAAAAAVTAGLQTAAELAAAPHQEPAPAAPAAAAGVDAAAQSAGTSDEIQAADVADMAAAAAAAPGVPADTPAAAADKDPQQPDSAAAAAAPQGPLLPGQADPLAGSGVMYGASGAELAVGKVAVGQQLDLLDKLQLRGTASDAAEAAAAAAAAASAEAAADLFAHAAAAGVTGAEVGSEELSDLHDVARELSQLRADNMELAANLQVTQSLVQHLNSSMKLAIDKADDAEADAMHVKQQLADSVATLQQLQSEQAELTRVLIDAKVEIAEKKGELMKLLRNLRRAVENPTHSGMLKELQEILAASNKHAGDAAAADSLPAPSPIARSFTANLAAGVERLGQAFKDSGSMRLSVRRRSSDTDGGALPAGVSVGDAAAGAAAEAGAAAAAADGSPGGAAGPRGGASRRASDAT